MARVKLSEWRAKQLLSEALNNKYSGIEVDLKKIPKIPVGKYAVKVDQAVKKRNKLGLIDLNLDNEQSVKSLHKFKKLGYDYALIEPMISHDSSDEKFLALERVETGIQVSFSNKGGVNIEDNAHTVIKTTFKTIGALKSNADLPQIDLLASLINVFEKINATYLEINPLLITDNSLIPLDAAIEVDSAAEFSVNGAWSSSDIRQAKMDKTVSEREVERLQSTSPASFTLRVLNPNGSIFLLLSGGGASVVIADELSQKGLTKEIVNYGEYSGNPTDDETYQYTKALLKLLKESKSKNKYLLIAGGVANFTDVNKTFNGIIHALSDELNMLKNENVGVFVRRGGPNQAKGLKRISEYLSESELNNFVFGSEVSLATYIEKAITEMKK